MTFSQKLKEYIAAAFSGLWVQSYEHEDALRDIAQLCRDNKWSLASWDIDRGLQIAGQAATTTANDPVAAIKAINSLATADSSALLVLPNFHRFMQSTEVVQALTHQIQQGKNRRTFIVVLAPVVQLPVELEKQFVVIEHDLPDRAQLQKIASNIATESGEMPKGPGLARLLDAASGLTRYEAEGAFSLSLVRHAKLESDAVWELKTQTLKKNGLLSLYRGGETFDDIGGLEAVKRFCKKALQVQDNRSVKARGILMLGVPGSGKSALAKALGNETGRPTLVMDVGALMGSLIGQTEQNLRQALRIVDAMAPCILFCDEIEKALSGVTSGGGDSGVSARLFGSLLTWLSDHQSDVFFIGTCNDISKLPPEFSRAERFDGVFFLDLPSSSEKVKIWEMYLKMFGLTAQAKPNDTDWTGAEIRACCRLSALLDVSMTEAAKHVVPVAVTAAESVEKLRNWASGRCLSASASGIFRRTITPSDLPTRKVSRSSSN